jgi:hypothetical protein
MKKVTISITAALFAHMGLTGEPDEQAFADGLQRLSAKAARVEALDARNTELQNRIDALNVQVSKDKITALLEKGLTDKLLTKELSDKLATKYADDPDGLKDVIDAMKPYESVTEKIILTNAGNTAEYEKYKGKTWDELDRGNMLSAVKAKFKDLYDEKFADKFGHKPEDK